MADRSWFEIVKPDSARDFYNMKTDCRIGGHKINEANFTISQIPSALAKDLGWSFQRDDSREVVKVLEADRKAGLVCDKTTSPRQSMRRRKARGLAFESDHLGTTGYSSSATRRLSVAKVYSIAGCMENTNVTACWDTGSDLNILREDEARRHGLEIDTSKVRSFKLPNKQTAKSIGQTFATFRFRDEQEGHKLRFEVVSNCPEDVILGLSFLRRTGTLLRKNAHRIQESSRICMQKGTRMLFVEDWHNEAQTNKSTMPFTVNGQQGNALPDSGSDIMAISGSYARRCGFDIDRTSRIEVLLADGTRMMTDGMVWDAALEFDPLMFADGWDVADYSEYMEGLRNVISSNRSGKGGFASTSVICDLHVIEDLPCDLILSTQFIMDNRALLRLHDDEMASAHNGAQDAEVLALRYGKNSWKRFLQIKLARKEGSSSISEPADGTASISENETEQERARKEEEVRSVEQEVAKRNEEDRLIRSQPAPERKKAIAAAQHRRRLWEQSLPPSPSSGATTITASAMSTPSGAAPSRSNIAR